MVNPNTFICFHCRHFRPISGGCAAFPDGIPYEISSLAESHDTPREGQGNDIVFTKLEEGEEPDEVKEALKK